MEAALSRALFAHPLAAEWLAFDLLPTRQAHPSVLPDLLPAPLAAWLSDQASPRQAARLHRHGSAALLRNAHRPLGRVLSLDDPALPLAMAPLPRFDRLLRACGLVLLGPAIRRVIGREEVALLESALAPQGLPFARGPARRLWPGSPAEPACALQLDQVQAQAQGLGSALLAAAFEAASAPVACRGRWRLAADTAAEAALAALPAAFRPPAAALALARGVLLETDPEWLSSFPAPR